MSLLPVNDALIRVLNAVTPIDTEIISIHDAFGRVTAQDIKSNLTQPPFDASAMDGYAVRHGDKSPLKLVGVSQAGKAYDGVLKAGETVRIFTGAPLVEGADTIIIQENVTVQDNEVTLNEVSEIGVNIRAAGGDFKKGDILVSNGTVINSRHIAVLTAGNVATLPVYKKPKVAILATGDELVDVGSDVSDDKIVNSNIPLFKALITEHGGVPIDLGIARDNIDDVKAKITEVKNVDMFVSIGGVSVGDYDIIQDVLIKAGLKVDFWKVAMQPGKPMIFGDFNNIPYFGMPGNPASAFVCFANFMLPALDKICGKIELGFKKSTAYLGHDLEQGGSRTNYLRAYFRENENGDKIVSAKFNQSSAKLKTLADANCLLIRDIDAPFAKAGEPVKIVLINGIK